MKMIKFNLSGGFKKVPEGEQILTITTCEPTPSGNPTGMKMVYTHADGSSIQETISFDKALWKISQICNVVFGAQQDQEMSVDDVAKSLKGKSIKVEVVHRAGTQPREDGTFPTFANVNKILGAADTVSESDIPANMTAQALVENPRSSILAGL